MSILGCDIVSMSSLFGSWLEDAVKDLVVYPIVKAYLIGWIATEATLFAAMYAGPFGFVVGLAGTIIAKEVLFQLASADPRNLKGAFVGALFSWAYGFLATLKQVANLAIAALSEFLNISELNFWKLLYKFIYIPINVIYLVRIILRLVEVGMW